jgi:hypothetical protein
MSKGVKHYEVDYYVLLIDKIQVKIIQQLNC